MKGDLDLRLETFGADTRALAANLSGIVFVDSRGGRLGNSRALQAIYGNMLTEIINVINPFYEAKPYTDIECLVIASRIENGHMHSAPGSYLSTDMIRVNVLSDVNLDTEALNINFRMRPQQGLKISSGELLNPYVKVVGTLAAPRLAVDEAGVLITGGTAVATGGLSILAGMAWDRLSRGRDPCAEFAKNGREELQDFMPPLGENPAASSAYSKPD